MFKVVAGNNYLKRKQPCPTGDHNADVLKVGNGYVVYLLNPHSHPNVPVITTEANFCKSFKEEDVADLEGRRWTKRQIIRANPDAESAW